MTYLKIFLLSHLTNETNMKDKMHKQLMNFQRSLPGLWEMEASSEGPELIKTVNSKTKSTNKGRVT